MKKKLLPGHKKALEPLLPFIEEGKFYLAGGTALYYYFQHRESLDLDFFTPASLDFLSYQRFFSPFKTLSFSSHTIHLQVEGVNVSFFRYPYKLLSPLNTLEMIKVAHPTDILCMKINALINRGSRKDFTDVYFIMKEFHLTAAQCIKLFREKYGDYNPLIIHKALTFFEDAENEPELKMLKPVDWEEIKKFFLKEFLRF